MKRIEQKWRHTVLKGIVLALASAGMMAVSMPASAAPAPLGQGFAVSKAPSKKTFLGTSNTDQSQVYFTGANGVISEVFYPRVDSVSTKELQFLVGDSTKTWLDEESKQTYTVTRTNPKTLTWTVMTTNTVKNWRITKTVFTDPNRNTLVARVTFEGLNGKRVNDFNLYLLHKPTMNNTSSGWDAQHSVALGKDIGRVINTGGRSWLTAAENGQASALVTSLPWKTVGSLPAASVGYTGTANDGFQDLIGDKTMNSVYDYAEGGVTHMGWLNTNASGTNPTSVSFDVVLGFAGTETNAINTATASLSAGSANLQTQYDTGWLNYSNSLNTYGGTADAQYYLSAMSLKASQDKTNGAIVAGLGTPWGEDHGEVDNNGTVDNFGYHLVWPRDLFKFANALLTAGDVATPTKTVKYLFNYMQQPNGRFPQNSWVNGQQFWGGTQMDQQGMPILLAWRTYQMGDAQTKADMLALYPKFKLTAQYLVDTGPWTHQERWEETSGYSPSTIAAEIAGLVAAAEFAKVTGDTAAAALYMKTADYWQQNIDAWTYTTAGPLGNNNYYVRINPSAKGSLTGMASYAPQYGPNANISYKIGNGGNWHDQKKVVDGGFLELVRLGVKNANSATVLETLPEYDAALKQTIAGKGDAWFRYNFDGYGETNVGEGFIDPRAAPDSTGYGKTRGRLWPIFTAERGMYEILRNNSGASGSSYLTMVRNFSTPEKFVPEQVWNNTTTVTPTVDGGWQTTLPAGYTAGSATKSIAPLNWAMGEYISLLASINKGTVVDVPSIVCVRYNNCTPVATAGQITESFNVNANTSYGQQVYVTGNTAALGNWNVDLGIPLDATTYPTWKNKVVLPASSNIQYKYYRKNPDGTVTWENISGGGNRNLTTSASGTASVNDTVAW